MEIRDLYDIDRNIVGKIKKDEIIPENFYILVVIIFMQNKDGKFLIQKRSEIKGGKWATTGGHPKSGESSYQGIITEVKEELGIDISKEDVKFLKTKIGHGMIFDLYYVKMDIDLSKLVLQSEEVADVKLSSIPEIKEMIENGEFHESHGKAFLNFLIRLEEAYGSRS